MATCNREELFGQVQTLIHELFEIPIEDIKPEAHLRHDLDIDSIDAVDLVVELKNLTGKKIRPEDFKSAETVDDVLDAVIKLG